MTDAQLLNIALSIVATFFALLVALLGWLGNKFYTKLDEISKNLVEMAGELHERINGLDRRVTRVETQFEDSRHG
jgi:predicted PurR-regulated permease PerM